MGLRTSNLLKTIPSAWISNMNNKHHNVSCSYAKHFDFGMPPACLLMETTYLQSLLPVLVIKHTSSLSLAFFDMDKWDFL